MASQSPMPAGVSRFDLNQRGPTDCPFYEKVSCPANMETVPVGLTNEFFDVMKPAPYALITPYSATPPRSHLSSNESRVRAARCHLLLDGVSATPPASDSTDPDTESGF